MRISIAMATYNGAKFLQEQLDSFLCQTRQPDELVISDDCSTDKTDISIGERCLIDPNFFACDSDFHGLAIKNRSNGNYDCLLVHVGNDVFIGEGVKVMKGVAVGDGAVIGSGSIVVKDVEPNSINAGVPSRFIRNIPVD